MVGACSSLVGVEEADAFLDCIPYNCPPISSFLLVRKTKTNQKIIVPQHAQVLLIKVRGQRGLLHSSWFIRDLGKIKIHNLDYY